MPGDRFPIRKRHAHAAHKVPVAQRPEWANAVVGYRPNRSYMTYLGKRTFDDLYVASAGMRPFFANPEGTTARGCFITVITASRKART